jgi:hypothetical protein
MDQISTTYTFLITKTIRRFRNKAPDDDAYLEIIRLLYHKAAVLDATYVLAYFSFVFAKMILFICCVCQGFAFKHAASLRSEYGVLRRRGAAAATGCKRTVQERRITVPTQYCIGSRGDESMPSAISSAGRSFCGSGAGHRPVQLRSPYLPGVWQIAPKVPN